MNDASCLYVYRSVSNRKHLYSSEGMFQTMSIKKKIVSSNTSHLCPPGALHRWLRREAGARGSLWKNGKCFSGGGHHLRLHGLKPLILDKHLVAGCVTVLTSSLTIHVWYTTYNLTFTVGGPVLALPGFWPDQRAFFCQLQLLDGKSCRSLPGSPHSRWRGLLCLGWKLCCGYWE